MRLPTVLVVDDDDFARALLVNRVGGALGAQVLEAANGVEALEVLRHHVVDLCLVDLQMPKLDGFELLGCIRVHPRYKHLPVVVITGSTEKANLDRALEAGATSFLAKPINWAAFGSHIGHLLTLVRGVPVDAKPHRVLA